MFKSVEVAFTYNVSAEGYHYLVPTDDQPSIGDLVLVSTFWNDEKALKKDWLDDIKTNKELRGRYLHQFAQSFAVGVVKAVNPLAHAKGEKFYFKLLKTTDLAETLEKNVALLQKQKAMQEALVQLELRAESFSKLSLYRQMAKDDPVIAELLKLVDPAQEV